MFRCTKYLAGILTGTALHLHIDLEDWPLLLCWVFQSIYTVCLSIHLEISLMSFISFYIVL
jgi:hypothetical protein